MSPNAEDLAMMRRWRLDPVAFYDDVFNGDCKNPLDEWQRDALRALVTNDRVAFIASKGVGKSFLEAVAGWWWMVTRERAQVICTSITSSNLRSGLWKEIGGLYSNSNFLQTLFQLNSERVMAKEDPTNWFMEARSWRDSVDAIEQAQALAGLHGPAMLWLGDEAGSYHHAILASGSAMLANVVPGSGREGKILLGGNPTDPKGPLGDISRKPMQWHVVYINGDPANPKRSPRISLEWAQGEIDDHGIDNPWVKVSVLGQFPDAGFMNLLGPADIEKAKRRIYTELDYQHAQKRIGVDPARSIAGDATIVCVRQGLHIGPFLELRGLDGPQVAERVALSVARTGAEVVYVDEIGVGYSVLDHLRILRVRCVGVNSSTPATDPRYMNRRAEMWCGMAEHIKKAAWLPMGYPRLDEDLMMPEYGFKKAQQMIEDKDQIKKRLGRSPDWGDSLGMTYASIDVPAGVVGYGETPGFVISKRHKSNSDFDPHRSMREGNQDRVQSEPFRVNNL
jgi:hypothetical protein